MTPDEFDDLMSRIGDAGYSYGAASRSGISTNPARANLEGLIIQARAEHRRLTKLVEGYKTSCEAFKAKHKVATAEKDEPPGDAVATGTGDVQS